MELTISQRLFISLLKDSEKKEVERAFKVFCKSMFELRLDSEKLPPIIGVPLEQAAIIPLFSVE